MCKQIGYNSTLTIQISNIIIPPKLEQILDMAEYLEMTVDELLSGESGKTCASLEALIVEQFPRLQKIIRVLQLAPDKLDALETFLDIKHFSAGGGGGTQKLRTSNVIDFCKWKTNTSISALAVDKNEFRVLMSSPTQPNHLTGVIPTSERSKPNQRTK